MSQQGSQGPAWMRLGRRLLLEHPVIAISALALAVRLIYFTIFSAGAGDPLTIGGGDGLDYWALGVHLSESLSFEADAFIFRPPGYPAAIAVALVLTPGTSEWVPIVVSLVASVAIVPATYALARLLGLPVAVSAIAGLIVAIEPTSASLAVTPLADSLVTLFFVVAAALAVAAGRSSRHWLRNATLAGCAAGLAMLAKPLAVALGALLAASVLVGFRRAAGVRVLAAAGVIVAVSLVPYVGWTYANERNFGAAEFSSAGNWTLYFHRATGVLRRVTGEPPGEIEQDLADRLSVEVGAPPGSRNKEFYLRTTDAREIDKMRELAIDVFTDHPFWFAAMYPVGGLKLLFNPIEPNVPVPAYIALMAILYALAAFGLRCLWRENRFAAGLIAAVVLYVVVATTTVQSGPTTRLFLPAIPFIAIAAAVGIDYLGDKARSTRPPSASA